MLKQDLSFKLQQKLSPQQIQLMKLVQLSTLDFEERLLEELEDNPALEDISKENDSYELEEFSNERDEEDYYDNDFEDHLMEMQDSNIDDYITDDEVPYYKTAINNYSSDDEEYVTPYASGTTLHEHLLDQLHTIPMEEEDYEIADFLLGSIDEDGYIRRELKSLADDLVFTQNIFTSDSHLEFLLTKYIHKLEPIGVGARNLQECLLIQLKAKPSTPEITLATNIIKNKFDEFTKKHFNKIQKTFNITDEMLKSAVKEIEKLTPKPGKAFSENTKIIEQITPDFTVMIIDGEIELRLNSLNSPELRISDAYKTLLDNYKEKNSETKKASIFIKQKLDTARWFIDAVKQRENTLMLVMSSIIDYQKEYFLTGDDEKLRPMILKDISDNIQMDISTVSRVVNSKYVATPYGTMLIKDLFSESMTTLSGEEVSTREIKKILQKSIDEENKKSPVTDDRLSEILNEKGYKVARRTVAKYREQLNIPVARLRKEL